MLDIPKRIEIIQSLLLEDTRESLTYAALEGGLTIEYLCYERFDSVLLGIRYESLVAKTT